MSSQEIAERSNQCATKNECVGDPYFLAIMLTIVQAHLILIFKDIL